MADLRDVATALGHADVATYIQSGNLLFTCSKADPASLGDALEAEIAGRLGVRPAVVVISAPDLDRIIAENPFPAAAATNPRFLHAVFRRDAVDQDGIAAVAAAVRRSRDSGSKDDAVIIGRTMYLHTPDGLGRSDLATRLARASVQTAGTARNWATVTKLMAMLSG